MSRIELGVQAIKELVSIIMGIAVANIVTATVGITLLKVTATSSHFVTPSGRGFLAIGGALVMLVTRFYHGNVRAIDEEWQGGGVGGDNVSVVEFLELAVVMVEGSLFAAFGLLLERPDFLWGALFGLFSLDVVFGLLGFWAKSAMTRPKKIWLVLNGLTIAGLTCLYLYHLSFARMVVGIVGVSTLLDYTLNWNLFFPKRDPQN
jgi:hypothetical protein